MPYGKFIPAENKIITNIYGEKVPLNKPAGYAGLFWGSVLDANGKTIQMASDYFWDREDFEHGFNCWEIIDEFIGQHCAKYVSPYCGEKHGYQYGFGGDECDGLIDFWATERIPTMPDMPFEIAEEKYTITWRYSAGHSDDDEDDDDDDGYDSE